MPDRELSPVAIMTVVCKALENALLGLMDVLVEDLPTDPKECYPEQWEEAVKALDLSARCWRDVRD